MIPLVAVQGEREQLKIHATVINTRHRSYGPSGHKQQSSSSTHGAAAAPSRIGIDARKLLAEHKDLDVGRWRSRLSICRSGGLMMREAITTP